MWVMPGISEYIFKVSSVNICDERKGKENIGNDNENNRSKCS